MQDDCTLQASRRLYVADLEVAVLKECGEKQNAEENVYAAERQILRVQAILQIEYEQRSAVAELLQYGRDHHGAQAQRVTGNHDEHGLKGQAYADKAVVKRRVRDWGRVLSADQIKDEIQRCQD
jgi:hypothetical protein